MAAGTIYALKEKTRKALIPDLENPYGLALHGDWLYVAESTFVKRYRYDSKTLTVSGEGEEIIPLEGFGGGHVTRTILFDQAHKKLYLSVGSESSVSLGEPPLRAAISRFNPNGSDQEIFASGLRNAVGLRFYPESDVLG